MKRVTILKETGACPGPVVCWMSRDQRVHDNWALLYAQDLALSRKAALHVVFCLAPSFLEATLRQYAFMIAGLREVEEELEKRAIPFHVLAGAPGRDIPRFIREEKAGILIADFDPLRIKRKWKDEVAHALSIPFHEVDAHNIIPCRETSPKQEYAARTIRPRIHKLLNEFLEPFPALKRHPFSVKGRVRRNDWTSLERSLKVDASVAPVNWIEPGPRAAERALRRFIAKKLTHFDAARNDPSLDGQSNLSPYLHFGHLSAAHAALEVMRATGEGRSRESFLEELIVRRELSDNFCFYNRSYDTIDALPSWARSTLKLHGKDRREYLYSLNQLEAAETHDALWNAAQMEMVIRGKMHGYMRMYWAKKILEWSKTAKEALAHALYLNDRYELDGRDPNGYAGCAWAIGGVHDRPWPPRPVFGTIRFMSERGCRSKFDVESYIRKVKEEG